MLKFVGDIGENPFRFIMDSLSDLLIDRKDIPDGETVQVEYLIYSEECQKFFDLGVMGGVFTVELLCDNGIWNLMDFKEKS